MNSNTFILLGITYYILALVIIIVVLNFINRKENNKYKNKISNLERNKNLIISVDILSELNKVEGLINNASLEKKYQEWKERFNEIKEKDIPQLTDDLLEIEDLYSNKNYKELKRKLSDTEYKLYFVKTKSNYLLSEIKEITTSEDRNRELITKLKTKYRKCIADYNNKKNEYEYIMTPLELQFENIDKLFSAFEVSMDKNNYSEVGKIVKTLDDMIGNLSLVIEEAPSIRSEEHTSELQSQR